MWATAGLVVTLAGAAGGLGALAVVPEFAAGEARRQVVTAVVTAMAYGLVGSVLLRRRPDLPFGWLLTGAAASQVLLVPTVGTAIVAIGRGDTESWRVSLLGFSSLAFAPVAVQGLINVRFPSGRPAGRFERVLDRLLIGGTTLVLLSGVFGGSYEGLDEMVPGAPARLDRPLTGGTPVGAFFDAMVVAAPLIVLLGLIAGLRVVLRCFRATGIERQQLMWRAAGIVVAFALFPLAVTDRLWGAAALFDPLVFVATLAIPVMRYRLWAIDLIVERSVLYAGVTAVLVGVYVAVVWLAAGLASARTATSLAAGGVALAFLPVRSAFQRVVDRLFYGLRSDPYRALSDVGRRLDSVVAPGEVLPAVVAAVGSTLRLPYVAIERPGDGSVLAVAGDAVAHGGTDRVERWPLTYEGSPVGWLAAAPRRGEAEFDERDRRVLADLARQAGPAVRAEALTADLLESRQRIVTAREEERRRLRRDLHDGLGPMLTGLGLNLDAARSALAASDLARAEELVGRAKEASSRVIADLRGMVYDLRPPALDDLGLAAAVKVHAERIGAGRGLQVDVSADGLPELPAAVEVAAFRTAVEAITNAVRHGAARRCVVHLVVEGGGLRLSVTDDGSSPGAWEAGVGLTAMRERASELGGVLVAGPTASGGRVEARYPLVDHGPLPKAAPADPVPGGVG